MATGRLILSPGPAHVQSAGQAATLAHDLPKLANETELQKMLADERMRSQMHRTHYEHLKEEHKRLQDEYAHMEDEIKRTIEESKIVQEKYKSMYEQCRKDLMDKNSQHEELMSKVVTPQRLEIIRMQLTDELEKSYREKFQKQEEEIDEFRNECNKLKYELSFVKSEYEHERLESQRIIEEIRMQHEAEVSNLRKEREVTINRIQTDCSQDSQRVRVLQRDNAQLHLKVKGLLSELEEIRAQREKEGLESDSVSRIQSKQLTEHATNVKSLETERESLRKQIDALQRDLTETSGTHNKLSSKIHDLEKENMMLRNRMDEEVHKSKVDVTNVKMDMLKQRGELERERDRLSNMVEDIKVKLDIARHTIDKQEKALAEKEREVVLRVQGAREEEFEKITRLENEKMELESKLHEIDRRRIDEESHKHAEKEKMEDRMRSVMDNKETAEREVLVLKAKITHHDNLVDQLERERSENSELKTKISRLETEVNSIIGNEHDMTDENIRLKNQVELLKEEAMLSRDQLNKAHDNHDRILAQQKAAFAEDRTQLELRVHDLGEKFGKSQEKLSKTIKIHKKLKSRSQRLTEHFKQKLLIAEAKHEELELEKKALQKCVPQDTYNTLKKQLKELQRRNGDFKRVMLASVHQVPIGDLSFGSVNVPFDSTFPGNITFTEQEKKHQEDIRLLKQRLDLLDDNQRQQFEDLQDVAHSTLRTFEDDDSKEKEDLEKMAS